MTLHTMTQRQEVLRNCTTRALEARSAIRQAILSFERLPEPEDSVAKEAHKSVSLLLKRANAEVFEILFCSSLAFDSLEPQVPKH
jgi:hypothetical protein